MITRDELKQQLREEVAYYTEHPRKIREYWTEGRGLFRYVEPYDLPCFRGNGCLTMIRQHGYLSAPENADDLTEAIRSIPNFPNMAGSITPEHLPLFLEWQLKVYDYYHHGWKPGQPWSLEEGPLVTVDWKELEKFEDVKA